MKKILAKTLLVVMMAFLVASCHSSKSVTAVQTSKSSRSESAWTNVYGSVNLSMTRPMSMGFSGKATMERGKYIHVSMRMIGFEVGSMYIDADSAYVVDKFHRYLFAEPLSVLLGERYDYLTIYDLQDIVLGQKPVPETERASVVASDFVDTPAGMVASLLKISVETPKTPVSGALEWNPASATWNDPKRTATFSVPKNYTRISVDNLKEMLKSF